jgi:hypothetical protein
MLPPWSVCADAARRRSTQKQAQEKGPVAAKPHTEPFRGSLLGRRIPVDVWNIISSTTNVNERKPKTANLTHFLLPAYAALQTAAPHQIRSKRHPSRLMAHTLANSPIPAPDKPNRHGTNSVLARAAHHHPCPSGS